MGILTQQAIAEHLGLSQQQVSEWLRRLNLTPDAGLDSIRLAYIAALRSAAARGSSDEREAWLRAKRQIAELELAEKEGRLVDAETVRRCTLEFARAARDAILGLVYRLDPLLAGERDEAARREIWTRELRTICEHLARVPEISPPEQP